MFVNAGDDCRVVGVNGPQCVAIVGEVEFDRWQSKALAELIDFSLAQAPGLRSAAALRLTGPISMELNEGSNMRS